MRRERPLWQYVSALAHHRRTLLTAAGGLLLALLLGAGMLRSDASAQSTSCFSSGYAGPTFERPSARFDAAPAKPQVAETVTFDGSLSSRADGSPVERWAWDLDGDNRYETTQTTPTVTHAYDKPGAVTVRLIVVDRCGNSSGPFARVIEVVTDGTPPALAVDGPTSLRLSKALRKPVRLSVGCTEPCAVSIKASVDAKTRRKLKRSTARIGSASTVLPEAGIKDVAVKLVLPAKARKRARKIRRGSITFKVAARDAAGNRVVSSHRAKLR